tara:strand:+ start:1574 stop:1867 length:294 start_codon:yes stop_codon:yes gene_type:complete
MRLDEIKYITGLRDIDLRKNNLGDKFIEALTNCLKFDSYMKVIDLSHNKINNLRKLPSVVSKVNQSIIGLNIRWNPGTTEKITKMNALTMLRNISDL